jgi:hypothetical protein
MLSIILNALVPIFFVLALSGFFGILFGLRYGIQSQQAGSTLIASSVLSAITVAAAILLPSPGAMAGRPNTPDVTLYLQTLTWRHRQLTAI